MPLYAYECECGNTFDKYLPLSEYDAPQACECGKTARKVLGLNFLQTNFEPYVSPASGRVIESKRARRDDLDRTNSRPWEGLESERKEAARRREYADQKLESTIQKSIEDQLRTV